MESMSTWRILHDFLADNTCEIDEVEIERGSHGHDSDNVLLAPGETIAY